MKRFVTILLALTMLASVGSVAYAEDIDGRGEINGTFPYEGSTPIGVHGIYDAAENPEPVYSVKVEWDSLQFSCSLTGDVTWHPNDHTYDDQRTFTWNKLSDGDPLDPDNKTTEFQRTIRVTNNSSADVYAKATLETQERNYGFGLIVAPIDKSEIVYNRAYNPEVKNDKIFTVTLKPPSTPDINTPNDSFQVGKVTITLSTTSLDNP